MIFRINLYMSTNQNNGTEYIVYYTGIGTVQNNYFFDRNGFINLINSLGWNDINSNIMSFEELVRETGAVIVNTDFMQTILSVI